MLILGISEQMFYQEIVVIMSTLYILAKSYPQATVEYLSSPWLLELLKTVKAEEKMLRA